MLPFMQIKLGLTGKKLHDSLTNLLPVPRLRLLAWSALAAAWPNVLSTIQDGELLPCSSGFVPSSIKQTHLGNSIERNWRNVMKEYIPHFLFQRFFRGYPCWKKSNRTQNTTSSTENEGQFSRWILSTWMNATADHYLSGPAPSQGVYLSVDGLLTK